MELKIPKPGNGFWVGVFFLCFCLLLPHYVNYFGATIQDTVQIAHRMEAQKLIWEARAQVEVEKIFTEAALANVE